MRIITCHIGSISPRRQARERRSLQTPETSLRNGLAPVVRVFGCGEVRGGFPGNPCHMAPATVTVNQMARGGLQKDPWHMPTAIWSLRSLACDLVLGIACYTTRFANDPSCGARFASIHRVCSVPSLHMVCKTIPRVAHGSHRFIV